VNTEQYPLLQKKKNAKVLTQHSEDEILWLIGTPGGFYHYYIRDKRYWYCEYNMSMQEAVSPRFHCRQLPDEVIWTQFIRQELLEKVKEKGYKVALQARKL
jgi:gamma-glutamyltranspeptidase